MPSWSTLQNPLIFAFYTAGILSAGFHLGNGLWTFLITWGITVGKRAQRISQWVTTAISVAMSVLGMAIIIAIVASRRRLHAVKETTDAEDYRRRAGASRGSPPRSKSPRWASRWTSSRSCRCAARTRSARRAASTPPLTPRAKATPPGSTSTIRSMAATSSPTRASVKGMCEAGPAIIFLLDRMGVMFNRTPEGNLDFRRFGGTKHHRTAFAGATTGQQLLYALDEQVRREEVAGKVRKYENWEFLSAVLDDDGVCRGIVAQDMNSMEIRAFPADAVILATGGPGLIFGLSTNSMINTGTAAGAVYQQGAWYANGEFIQVHPTAIPGEDKLRLMSESIRGEGGASGRTRTASPGISLKRCIPRTAIWCPAISPPARFPRLRRSGPGRGRPEPGLPRREPSRPAHARSEAGRRHGDLPQVRGRRPGQGADAHLPGGALLDGRPVGGQRARA